MPHTPELPVGVGEAGTLDAVFLIENRTRERWMELRTGNSGISLVFREMWGATDGRPFIRENNAGSRTANL